jgi:dTDP-4-dehydrorhamnose reductase
MKIYILGATGFLGSGAVKYFQKVGHTVLTEKTDIRDYGAIKKSFEESKPDVAINFSGVRARPNIDWCEDHKEETLSVNVGGAINFSVASIESGVYPIQISSGCIYSGGADHPFTEDDPPNFFGSFYSRSRIIMQEVLKEIPVLQVRIRMPISY